MKELQIKGGIVLVDDEDYERISQIDWHVNNGYARNRQCSIYMHNLILGIKGIDHKNGNGLDNRRSNLRPATPQENLRNMKKETKGVSWNSVNGNWRAYIFVDNKQINLGSHKTKLDAALAYNKAAKKLFGEFAAINEWAEQEAERRAGC